MRDYTSVQGGWYFDYWLSDDDKRYGYWYVNEPKGQWNDAWYEELPWRGLTRAEYLKESK